MKNGFIKVAAYSPRVTLARPIENAKMAAEAVFRAESAGAKLLVLPELFLSGYSVCDLLRFSSLVSECEKALEKLLSDTAKTRVLTLVGLPVAKGNSLYNCAAVIFGGEILGVVPKTHLTYSEQRYFESAPSENCSLTLCGRETAFGAKQLFTFKEMPSFVLAAEICNDLWVNIPPSAYHAEAGATVVANLAASPEYSGHREKRRTLITSQSLRSACGYVFASAGEGESTTDLVYSGHCAIAECGKMLIESEMFAPDTFTVSEIDCELILSERRRNGCFKNRADGYIVKECSVGQACETSVTRKIERFPFIKEADLGAVLETASR